MKATLLIQAEKCVFKDTFFSLYEKGRHLEQVVVMRL